MLPNLTAPLRKALSQLEAEKQRIDQEMVNIRAALQALGDKGQPTQGNHRRAPGPSPQRAVKRRVSVAARKAVSEAMKKYWAKRKAAEAKSKAKELQKLTAKAT